MATRVTLNTVDGQLVVDKTALEGDRPDRKAEARWLAEARHPNVVRLVSFENAVLRTQHAGQTTLRTATLSPSETAALFLGLARTLTDLHNRDLVHGKLTLDHVIVSTDPTRARGVVLCSPDGGATRPQDDLRAVGGMVDRLLARWDEQGTTVPGRDDWQRIRSRLEEPDDQITAQRVARWFAPLVVVAPPSNRELADDLSGDKPQLQNSGLLGSAGGRGVAVLMGFVAFVVGVTVWNPLNGAPTSPRASIELTIGHDQFEVDGLVDTAVGTPVGCPPEAAVLDHESTVWRFVAPDDRPLDRTVGQAEAMVPGATELVYEDCELWAVGPAGRTMLERP